MALILFLIGVKVVIHEEADVPAEKSGIQKKERRHTEGKGGESH